MVLIRNLLLILKPGQFNITGKIGFADPFYTGLLAALTNVINYSGINIFVDLEPVFEEECLAIKSTLKCYSPRQPGLAEKIIAMVPGIIDKLECFKSGSDANSEE